MSARKGAQKPVKKATPAGARKTKGFTDFEKAAMKDRIKELNAETRGANRADGERDVLARIADMQGLDQVMAKRLHALITSTVPSLSPKTWYGMPAYARDGKVVCFFQDAKKFKARYATLGFSDEAKLDDGAMWPTSFALKEWTPAEEARITGLLKKALG